MDTNVQRRNKGWIALGVGVAVLGAVALAIAAWIPSEAELARMAEAKVSAAVGAPVTIGRLHWQLLPTAQVVVEDVRADPPSADVPPLTIGRIVAEPRIGRLLRGKIAVGRLVVEDASLPQPAMSGFKVQQDMAQGGGGRLQPDAIPLERAEFRNVRWVSRQGKALAYEGDVDFDPNWRPRRGTVVRSGAPTDTRLLLTRQGQEDRWAAEIHAGGRTEQATLDLQEKDGGYQVRGTLDFKQVELVPLLSAFDRKSAIAGKASGHTDLRAQGADPGALLRSANTTTRFSVNPATLLTFDLEAAVKSAGTHRGGTTKLDQLTGVVETQNDPGGIIVRYTDLKAKSGVLTATGQATLQSRRIKGDVAVDIVDGVVGLPLQFGGTVDDPTLSLSAAALAGAAVGTAVAPGLGTAIGARVGETIRKIFGADEPEKPQPVR